MAGGTGGACGALSGGRTRLAACALGLAVALLGGAGCETRGPEKGKRVGAGEGEAEGEGSASGSDSDSASGSGSGSESESASVPLPDASSPETIGEVTPAPWLEGALRVAAVRREDKMLVVAAGIGWLRLYRADGEEVDSAQGEGGAQLLEVLDVDGDGQEEILVGRGVVRGALGHEASLLVHRASELGARPEKIPLPESERAEVVGVAPASATAGDLYVAAYQSKYQVALLRARRSEQGTWRTDKLGEARVVGGIASVPAGGGQRALVVARVYGDSSGEPGGVAVHGKERRVPIPSTRGARAIAAIPGEEPTVLFTDGWHKRYAKEALALVTRAKRSGGGWKSDTLARVAERHGYHRLRIGDLEGDKTPEGIASGNGPPVAVTLGESAPSRVRALGEAEALDAFPADLDGDRADEVIFVGPSPGIWSRR